jgi:hypothetical protein
MNQLIKVLAVFVNYGDEQIHYLQELVDRLTQFKKYEVRIVVNSNIDIKIRGVDELNVGKLYGIKRMNLIFIFTVKTIIFLLKSISIIIYPTLNFYPKIEYLV